MEKADEKGFLRHADTIGKRVLEMKRPLVVGDYDCDGIVATSIASTALDRSGIEHEVKTISRRDETTFKEIAGKKEDELVFLDFGSGSLDLIEQLMPEKQVIIIDHHQPKKQSAITQVNPILHGFSGFDDSCSSTVSYLCFKGHGNQDLADLAVVGAVGDMQDNYGNQKGLVGLNRIPLEDGIEQESVFRTRDLKMFGRVSRPLVWFLAYSTEPFLPGLSGNEKACATFLEKNGIPLKDERGWLHYINLSVFQRRKLVSAIINYCHEKNLDNETTDSLVGETYLLLKQLKGTELSDAHEFSTLLNACGRQGHPGAGIAVCKKDVKAFEEAKRILQSYRMQISNGIGLAKKQASDYGAFYFLDGRKAIPAQVVGVVANAFLNSGNIQRTKPVVAFASDETGTKVSSRAFSSLVKAGLNLGEVMREAAASVGGVGGGHKPAAGATVPEGKEKEFLLECKKIVLKQLGH